VRCVARQSEEYKRRPRRIDHWKDSGEDEKEDV